MEMCPDATLRPGVGQRPTTFPTFLSSTWRSTSRRLGKGKCTWSLCDDQVDEEVLGILRLAVEKKEKNNHRQADTKNLTSSSNLGSATSWCERAARANDRSPTTDQSRFSPTDWSLVVGILSLTGVQVFTKR